MEGDVEGLIQLLSKGPAAGLARSRRALPSVADVDDRIRLLRVMADAARHASTIEESIAFLEDAESLAEQNERMELAAEAAFSLSGSLYMAGRADEAIAALERAEMRGGEVLASRVRFQRGTMAARDGDTALALALFAEALPGLHSSNDDSTLALLYGNRGNIALEQAKITDAEIDFTEALQLFERRGQMVRALAMKHNLAKIAALRGDYLHALREFESIGQEYAEVAQRPAHFMVDEVEILMTVGLYSEALASAGKAREALEQAGDSTELAHCWLLDALCRARLGRTDAAAAFDRASELFEGQGRYTWADNARVAKMQHTGVDRAVAVAAEARFRSAGADLSALRAHALVALSAPELAHDVSVLEDAASGDGVPVDVRFQAIEALAEVALAKGDRGRCEHWLEEALAAMRRVQFAVDASDVRSGLSYHLVGVRRLGERLFGSEEDAAELFGWVERSRRLSAHLPALMSTDPPGVRSLRAELRRLQMMARDSFAESLADVEYQKAEIERKLARTVRLQSVTDASDRSIGGELDDVPAVPDGAVVLQYRTVADRLHCVVATASGMTDVELGSIAEVLSASQRLRAALSSLAVGHDRVRAVRLLAEQVNALVVPEVDQGRTVVVIPTGELFGLPWRLLSSIGDRPFVIAASLRQFVEGASRWHTPRSVFAAAGPDLEHSSAEVRRVVSAYRREEVDRSRVSVDVVLERLAHVDAAHLCAHGVYRRGDARFSELRFSDGGLTVLDLRRLAKAPQLVALSACHVGIDDAIHGDELVGLVAELLDRGSCSVVGASGPVPDIESVGRFMASFHEQIAGGTLPAKALQESVRNVASNEREEIYFSLFSCFGFG